jgi:hypothetical protein
LSLFAVWGLDQGNWSRSRREGRGLRQTSTRQAADSAGGVALKFVWLVVLLLLLFVFVFMRVLAAVA